MFVVVVVVWHLSSDFILLFIEILTFKPTLQTSHSFKDDEEVVLHSWCFIDYFFFFFLVKISDSFGIC